MPKIVSLDIGGTNTRLALINSDYAIEKEVIRPTIVGNLDLFLDSVISIIKDTITDFSEVGAIAMGVPGRVRYDGFIYALPNIHISNIPLAEKIHEAFKVPTFVRNDAEVAALAEANVGPYKSAKSLYFITISTGVGGALTIGGKIRDSSYEVGHTMTAYHGEIHEFEHMASGVGLRRLCDMNGLQIAHAKEFFDLVQNKHPVALNVYKDWIAMLAEFIKMNQDNFEPEIFALTGGVMKSADVFLDDLRKACPGSRIEKCYFDQEAGLMGAAVLGFQNI